MNTFALITEDYSSDIINHLYYYLMYHKKYIDFHIFSDSLPLTKIKFAVLSSFYIRFYKNTIIFDNLDTYNTYKTKIISDSLILILNSQQLNDLELFKNLKNTKLLHYDGNQIYDI